MSQSRVPPAATCSIIKTFTYTQPCQIVVSASVSAILLQATSPAFILFSCCYLFSLAKPFLLSPVPCSSYYVSNPLSCQPCFPDLDICSSQPHVPSYQPKCQVFTINTLFLPYPCLLASAVSHITVRSVQRHEPSSHHLLRLPSTWEAERYYP